MKSKRSKPGVKAVAEGDLTRAPKFPKSLPSPNADHVAPHGWLSGGDRPAPGKTAKTKAKRGK